MFAVAEQKGVVSVRSELKVEPRFYVAYYDWPDSFPTSFAVRPTSCPTTLLGVLGQSYI